MVAQQVFQVFVVCQLHLVAQVDDVRQILLVVHLLVYSVLYAAVQVDGEHALGTRRHSSCTQSVRETVVLNFVTETAARA